MLQIWLKTAVFLVFGFGLAIGNIGCRPKTIISPVEDPVWLEKGEIAPFDGWLVTRGFMQEIIEDVK